jgi:hypothetical protein
MTAYIKTMRQALMEMLEEELSPEQIAAEEQKAMDQFNSDMAKEFPAAKFTARASTAPMGGGIVFVFAVIPTKDAKGVDLLNAPAHSKYMMHLTDNKNNRIPMSKFSIASIMGKTPVKFRKITGKSPTDAVKKMVDWFKKNKGDFEGLIKEEVELYEFTVSDVEIAMKKKYGKVDKEAIDKLKKVQHMGNVDRNALVKVGHGKLHVESVDLDEGQEKGPKQLTNPNKEVMVVKKNKVVVIDKKDQDKYLKQGWSLAEEVDLDEARQLKNPKKEVLVVKSGKVIVIAKKDAKEYLNKGWELAEGFELDEANFEIKNGKIHISKKDYAKKPKEYKGKRNGKPTLMALDPKSGATTSFEVVLEEVELDEAWTSSPSKISEKDFDSLKKGDTVTIEYKSAMSSGTGTFKVTAKNVVGKAKVEKVTLRSTKNPKAVKHFLYKRDDKVSFAQGDMGAAVVSYKKEEVELDEGQKPYVSSDRDGKHVMTASGKIAKSFKDMDSANAYLKKNYNKLMKEVVELDEAKYDLYHKDFSTAMQHAYKFAKKKGFIVRPEEIDMKVASGPRKPSKGSTNSYILGTDKKKNVHIQVYGMDSGKYELNMYIEEFVNESAKSDARRAMSRDKDLGRGKDSADIDDFATDDDIKGATKNIMMQLRKSISLRGSFPVEFMDKKKIKIPAKIAQAVTNKYNSLRRPKEKEEFQKRVSKSYKDMLTVVNESLQEDQLTKEDTILDRIANKIQERKNG